MSLTYEDLARVKVIGPRPAQIKGLLEEKPMSAEEIASSLGISVPAVRPHLKSLTKADKDIGKIRIGRNLYYFLWSVLEKHKGS